MLRLWNRLIKMDSSRITKKVFLWDYEKCTANWLNDIREILGLINMQNHFTSKTPVNNKHVKELFMVKTENDWKLVVVDQFTPGYQFTPTPKFIQNNHS